MSNKNKPSEIDVVIPVYNGEQFIIEAIDSAVKQTLPPKKIIVVDDGSTDTTSSLVEEYAKNSKIEIKLVKKTNGGLSSARNTGIKNSDSELIAFLDADDLWVKDKLEKQLEVYQSTNFEKLALIYCNYDVIDSNGSFMYSNYKAPIDKKRMRGNVFETLLERNKITSSGSGVLIKREVFDTIGFFDEKLRFGEDWDMWLRIAEKYEVDFTPETLVYIRKHKQNMTVNPVRIFERELQFYNKWINILNRRYPIPAFWSDKITFRIISGLPRINLLPVLKSTLSKENYKKLFRKTFGSFFLYIPLFFIRQIFNALFYPQYLKIFLGLIKHKGK